MSSWSPAKAQDELNKLIVNNEVQYKIGCCKRNYLIFPNDQHKYYYNHNKIISDSLKKKVYIYLYSPTNNMSKRLNTKTTVKDKNSYVHELVEEFKQVNNDKLKSVKIDLTKITLNEVVTMIQQNIDGKKLAIELPNNKIYMLNENTLNKLQKGLIYKYEEAIVNTPSDAELVTVTGLYKSITLKVIEPDPSKDKNKRITGKSRPAGGFFKYINTTKFDLSRYGVFNEIDSNNYNDNCLYIACELAGMPDHQLQMLKIFVMNRIVPKCKLKEICETLQICFKLTSVNNSDRTITETIGDKKHNIYHIGLICEHYFIYEKTNYTSYCLRNYEEVKDIHECNKIWTKFNNEYKKSNDKFIDSFTLIKTLLEHQETLLALLL